MRHLELHIIQSVPVSCLNRDDFGSPKTALFGNAPRARVSSQCWKRAVREAMQASQPALFGGQRTRFVLEPLRTLLAEKPGFSVEDAQAGAEALANALNKLDTPPVRIKTLFFTSPLELQTLAAAYAQTRDAKKAVKLLGKTALKDAADIALFGRMVANDHSLTLEGAAMFSHALSTHRVSNELDFFAAVDDLQPDGEAGAAITGTLEFNAATYYRFAALNLDMLADASHLGALTPAERQEVVRQFVQSTLTAMPDARQNSMHAATLPSHVLAVVREHGHPVQLVNAFEQPVWTRGGLVEESVQRLEQAYAALKQAWGLPAVLECRLPEVTLARLLEEVTPHVR